MNADDGDDNHDDIDEHINQFIRRRMIPRRKLAVLIITF
jgi:hypothetical protein